MALVALRGDQVMELLFVSGIKAFTRVFILLFSSSTIHHTTRHSSSLQEAAVRQGPCQDTHLRILSFHNGEKSIHVLYKLPSWWCGSTATQIKTLPYSFPPCIGPLVHELKPSKTLTSY